LEKTKLIVIGAGPAGYVAAIRAAQLGAEVTVIEQDKPGGVCVNSGCIPTKALAWSTELLEFCRQSHDIGIETGQVKANFSRMMAKKEETVRRVRGGVKFLLQANKINLIKGQATFSDPGQIKVVSEGRILKLPADKVIIATGSQPIRLPFVDYDHPSVMASEGILRLTEIPKTLIIVGAGVVGCEFASIFSSLGSKIWMIEMMENILPLEDKSVARALTQNFKKRGIEILTSTRLKEIKKYGHQTIRVTLEEGEEIEAEKMLICVGRRPNTENLGLDNLGLDCDEKGIISVDKGMQTSQEGIWAAGDVIGGILLAHVAFAEAVVAAERALGQDSIMNYSVVPNCIFTNPQIATVGLNRDSAQEKRIKVKTGRFPFAANGKAQAIGQTEGFVQLIVEEESKKVLGGQIIGPHAADLIHEIALAVRCGITADQITQTIHAHPTLPETIMEAALSALGKPLHIVRARM